MIHLIRNVKQSNLVMRQKNLFVFVFILNFKIKSLLLLYLFTQLKGWTVCLAKKCTRFYTVSLFLWLYTNTGNLYKMGL